MKKSHLFAREIADLGRTEKSGLGLSYALSSMVDSFITKIWNAAGQIEPPGVALLALGGYGRAEMAPFSDIDLMILSRKTPSGKAEEAVRSLVYALWDEGFQVGYSIRSFKDCLDIALSDNDTRTAVLEARYLTGSRTVYASFREDVYPKLLKTRARKYMQEKLKERSARQNSFGGTPYLLEPQIKEGEGGLRDIHTAFWLMRVAHGTDGFRGLDTFLARKDVIKLYAAYDFLQKIRIRLHLISWRKNDTLDFENQDSVAAAFGYETKFGFNPAERLMRRYYLHAREAAEISKELLDHAVRKVFGNIGGPSWFRREKLSPSFRILKGYLIAEPGGDITSNPSIMMEAFYLSARHEAPMSQGLKRLIKDNLRLASGPLRNDQKAASCFQDILSGPRAYSTLKDMHSMGFLGRYIPEFGRLRALVVREPYHRYTVDEHSLLAIKALESLTEKSSLPSQDLLQKVFDKCPEKHVLYLAVLMHDTGKGEEGHGHSQTKLTVPLERLYITPEDSRLVKFLVKNHLLMSNTAQKREIDDPVVISEFAAAVGDVEKLQYLLLLTYADISAVRPGFWSSWKKYLISELYHRTVSCLKGELDTERITTLLDKLDAAGKTAMEKHIETYSTRYLKSTPDEVLLDDLNMSVSAESTGRKGFGCRIKKRPAMGGAEIAVCAQDRPGLLTGLTGILAANSLNIVKAQAFSGRDGMVIDRFYISNWNTVFWDGLDRKVEDDLHAFIVDGVKKMPSSGRGKAAQKIGIKPYVLLDNETSEQVTSLEILCPDRLGLLSDVFDAIHKAGLNVVSARIETDGETASDVVYVRKGSCDRLFAVLALLWDVVDPS